MRHAILPLFRLIQGFLNEPKNNVDVLVGFGGGTRFSSAIFTDPNWTCGWFDGQAGNEGNEYNGGDGENEGNENDEGNNGGGGVNIPRDWPKSGKTSAILQDMGHLHRVGKFKQSTNAHGIPVEWRQPCAFSGIRGRYRVHRHADSAFHEATGIGPGETGTGALDQSEANAKGGQDADYSGVAPSRCGPGPFEKVDGNGGRVAIGLNFSPMRFFLIRFMPQPWKGAIRSTTQPKGNIVKMLSKIQLFCAAFAFALSCAAMPGFSQSLAQANNSSCQSFWEGRHYVKVILPNWDVLNGYQYSDGVICISWTRRGNCACKKFFHAEIGEDLGGDPITVRVRPSGEFGVHRYLYRDGTVCPDAKPRKANGACRVDDR